MIGIILGVTLVVTRPNGLLANRLLFEILDKLINIIRSIPFIILLSFSIDYSFLSWNDDWCESSFSAIDFGVVPFLLVKSRTHC